jgi:hypothetical protein
LRLRYSLAWLGAVCTVTAAAQQAPALSVWYPFASAGSVGQSEGRDCWPAYALYGQVSEGKYGSGLRLPGVEGNGLYLPNPAGFFGEEARAGTIALWVRPAAQEGPESGTRVLYDFMRDAGNTLVDGYEIVMFTDKGKLKAKPSLLTQMEVDSPLAPDRWTHLALTWDCTEGTALFVDGEKRAERNGAFEPTELEAGWPGRVGCHTPGGGFPFAGGIDELRLFNHRLTDEEVAQLPGIRPESSVRVVGDLRKTVTVRNAGGRAESVRVAVWAPGRHLAPPYRGYLPFRFATADPETRYWTAGTCESEASGDAASVAPGAEAVLDLPQDPGYLGPRTVRVIAGKGLTAVAITQDESAGLRIEPAGPGPLVLTAEQAVSVRLAARNELAGPYEGAVRTELLADDGAVLAETTAPVKLKPGGQRESQVALRAESVLAPGKYTLRISAGETVLDEEPLYVTAQGDARTLCAVGAAYVSPVDDAELLDAMVRDHVRFVRLHGKTGDYYSAGRNLGALLEHGLKAWRMPAIPYSSMCAGEERRAWVEATGRNLGRYLKGNPAVLMQSIAGEGLSAPPCYCDACTASFREYLRAKYGTLKALNEAWGSKYAAWDAVPQLGSPQDLDETAERLKQMRVVLELPADNQARWRKLFELDRTRAIEWKRWHEANLVDWYRRFAEAFHAENTGTPIGEQPCWPNFETHILFALGKITDVGGMDLYLPGEGPTTLGYAAELCLNFDMNASIFTAAGKPVMVHELYVQDNSPPLLPEAQGWWLLGRGYNLLTYFTYDYYHEGVRSGLPLIFGLFDKTGAPYPDYESFRRFGADLERFDRQWDATTLEREKPEVALFMGNDVSLASNLETGGATWEAAGVLGHNGAYWLTERTGHALDFINDDSLDRLAGKRALVVPWCHVMRAESVEHILAFARRGGTVIIDGAAALYDESYRPYPKLPGGGLAELLGVTLTGYEDEPNTIVAEDGTEIASRGVPQGAEAAGAEVVLRDKEGRPALVRAGVGRGKVLWFLSSLGRRNTSRVPDPAALKLWGSLLSEAGATPKWEFTPRAEGGKAVFDVAMRDKFERERFAFLVSFFESSQGDLDLTLPPGKWSATNALTGEPVDLQETPGKWRLGVDSPAYGTRVIRLVAAR